MTVDSKLKTFFAAFLYFGLLGCGPSKEDVPKLIKQLSSPTSSVRNKAALDLAAVGPEAKDAVPALMQLLYDPSNGIKTSAAYALREIGTPEAKAALERYRQD